MEHYQPIRAILEIIEQGHRFLVTSHARPDGDAMGSMLACGAILRQLGKHADVVSSDRPPLLYSGLPGADEMRCASRIEGDYDAVIVLECDGLERTGLQGLEGLRIINMDHHASGRAYGDVNWINREACAVAEMVYELALAAGAVITPDIATCIYTAVLTDTGSFCYGNTDEHTFELARELVLCGADPKQAAQQIYFSNPTSKMLLLGAALSNIKREGRIAWMWVTHNDMVRACAAEEDCEGIVNYAISIAGVDVAAFLRELPDRGVRVSMRSKGDMDAAEIAQHFGGGGHKNASGCTLPGPLPAAAESIVKLMRSKANATVHDVA
ncbi:MAG TPA: bifunctional oligoribonuclease/PAP phosphatase NrnA [Acidisarcina sp.]|nr:bifunctional oligoribonuclease/PAP phosphatase NrnA [Acidisarcina sp.]